MFIKNGIIHSIKCENGTNSNSLLENETKALIKLSVAFVLMALLMCINIILIFKHYSMSAPSIDHTPVTTITTTVDE